MCECVFMCVFTSAVETKYVYVRVVYLNLSGQFACVCCSCALGYMLTYVEELLLSNTVFDIRAGRTYY